MDFVNINTDDLLSRHRSGASARELAKVFGTSPSTIRKKLRKAGAKVLSSKEYLTQNKNHHAHCSIPGLNTTLTADKLKELWPDHSVSNISRITGATTDKIKRLAKKLNLPEEQHSFSVSPIQYEWDNYEWLYKHYIQQKLSLNKIADITRSNVETIKKKLLSHNIALRNLNEAVSAWNSLPEAKQIRSGSAKKAYEKTRDKLNAGKERYLASLPQIDYKNREWLANEYRYKNAAQIAKEQNIHPITIKYWLLKLNIYNQTETHKWTEEMRQKARDGSLQLWANDYDRLAFRSEAHRIKISEGVQRYFKDSTSGSLQSWKDKLSLTAKKLWKNADYRTKNKSSNRGRIIYYNPLKSSDIILLRSHLECAFAILLDIDPDISWWCYEQATIDYENDTGQHTYIIDFTIFKTDGSREYIEVKPSRLQLFSSKYVIAQSSLPWRFITTKEINIATKLFRDGVQYNSVNFHNKFPKSGRYTYWSKEKTIELSEEWKLITTKRSGVYFSHLCERNNC